jgi:large conductance mechanosensitive channel
MLKDFKVFISRGNVIELAIAVVIGAAFTKVVNTVAEGFINPIVGMLTSGIDFKSKFYDLSGKYNGVTDPKLIDEAIKGGVPLIRYGELVGNIINFLIVALVAFLIARWVGKYFASLAAPPTPTEKLLMEIRDLLKKNEAQKPF